MKSRFHCNKLVKFQVGGINKIFLSIDHVKKNGFPALPKSYQSYILNRAYYGQIEMCAINGMWWCLFTLRLLENATDTFSYYVADLSPYTKYQFRLVVSHTYGQTTSLWETFYTAEDSKSSPHLAINSSVSTIKKTLGSNKEITNFWGHVWVKRTPISF